VTAEFRPDLPRLAEHAKTLLSAGCDGVAVFGTTGEGPEFAVEDRMAGLGALIAGGVEPGRIITSVSALAIPDIVRLAVHATERRVDGVLLMPPCVFRGGITEEGAFRFFATVIDRVARSDLRLYLYHFPDICGVPVTPQLMRRLDERYPGTIAGLKDSGGDIEFTQNIIRRFSHLSVFTGTEIHVPDLLSSGARGTVCGLANVMPRLTRAMMDLPTALDRRTVLPYLMQGDAILTRHPFIASVKTVIAEQTNDTSWRRVAPPMSEIAMLERHRLIADFWRWDSSLPAAWQSLRHRETVEMSVA
jgi:4-hydroxy-tetrahydrodipicolinate synthase